MQDLHTHDEQYDILVETARVDDRTRVLKDGDGFAVLDRHGDVPFRSARHGLYHHGTRHLSTFALEVADERPILLGSTITPDNTLLAVDLTNAAIAGGGMVLCGGVLYVGREVFLHDGVLHQRLTVRNYAHAPVAFRLALRCAADFADVFEVRGARRARRGVALPPAVTADALMLSYRGLDGVLRRTTLRASPAPARATAEGFVWQLELAADAQVLLEQAVACERVAGAAVPATPSFAAALGTAEVRSHAVLDQVAAARTSDPTLDALLQRARADLVLMLSPTAEGLYPYAGVPWFSTPFGRDGIVTAWQTLLFAPNVALGVLRHLAATQATDYQPKRDAEPGKILHESRDGEMAVLGEVPFGRYYGSIDATPLFVALVHAYWQRTGDLAAIEALWPNVEAALAWLERDGLAGGQFVAYQRRGEEGLVNQGWKDSHDSVFHADGTLAVAPIALCEVQGYAYAAWLGAARLAEVLGQPERAGALRQRAETLRREFERAFWCEELGTYALALDGRGQPCRVRSSNAGQCLFTGIAVHEHATRVVRTLLDDASWSGWGIRTVAAGEARYNPMSYHDGSVWPHDNSLIASGMARYGFAQEALRIFAALCDAARCFDLQRLPELFCGFARRPHEGPTLYPVACSPQAWSVGAVFLCLQTCLGIQVDGAAQRLTICRPLLLPGVDELTIHGLAVGAARVDVAFHRRRSGEGCAVDVTPLEGEVQIRLLK